VLRDTPHQLQEVLAKNHVQHQHLRGAECQLRQELDGAKLALTSSQVPARLRVRC
jgi:hypothetical protein